MSSARIGELFERLLDWVPLPSYTRQIPLSEYTKADMDMAFMFVPEKRPEIVNRGTMSRNEFTELKRINLQRIHAELTRRGFVRE